MTEALVSMKVAASAKGCVYDTFRKAWRTYVRDEGFPAPVRDARPYRWRPSSLTAWQDRAEAATRAALLTPATETGAAANQNERPAHPATHSPAARRVDRERNAVLALMSGA